VVIAFGFGELSNLVKLSSSERRALGDQTILGPPRFFVAVLPTYKECTVFAPLGATLRLLELKV
jgi:hypothetical protein